MATPMQRARPRKRRARWRGRAAAKPATGPPMKTRGKVRARSRAPQAPATAVPTAGCRVHAGAPARAKISRTVRVRETGFLLRPKSRSDSQGQENLPVRVPRTDPTGHARMDGSQPIRHAIESNQLVNFKARAYQRPFVALDQHFGYQGPRVVGTRLDGAIGACRHHGKQCTFRRFQHLPVDGEEIAALTHWPHHVGANAAPERLFRYGPNLVVRVI